MGSSFEANILPVKGNVQQSMSRKNHLTIMAIVREQEGTALGQWSGKRAVTLATIEEGSNDTWVVANIESSNPIGITKIPRSKSLNKTKKESLTNETS